MLPGFPRRFLLAAILLSGLLLLSCGGKEEATGTPTAENVPGVTDTEILIGAHYPLSQTPAAAYAPIVYGARAYFDYVNAQGGVYGRKIRYLVGDDHYNPADALEATRKLVEQDHVFAMVLNMGESTHDTVYRYLEEQGIPDISLSSGLTKWTDPVVHTRFGGNPNYQDEGKILGQYIAKNYPGKKLGLLVQNDEFGADGEKGLRMGLEGSDVQIAARETYESTQWDVTAQTQRLKNAGVDVVAAYAIPPPAASMVKTAREILNWDVPFVVTGVDVTDIFVALASQQNAEGVISVVFGKEIYQTDDPGVQKYIQIMKDFGQGTEASNFTFFGEAQAEGFVRALQQAGPNLTREGLIDAFESTRDWCCTLCILPVNLSPTDHSPTEMEEYVRMESGKWVVISDPINFESTPGKAIGCKGEDQPIYPDNGG